MHLHSHCSHNAFTNGRRPTDDPFSLSQILKKAWSERAKVGSPRPQVGIPLVKNGLAGYKTSILSYGLVIYRILARNPCYARDSSI
jgi:hypothetical protein